MTSDLTRNVLYILVRSVSRLVDDTPANDANGVLLRHCKETLIWLQTRAQKIKTRRDINEMLTTATIKVNKKIDCVNESARDKQAMHGRQPDRVKPFNLVSLMAAWDRDFPGGSAAVIATLKEILSSVHNREQD